MLKESEMHEKGLLMRADNNYMHEFREDYTAVFEKQVYHSKNQRFFLFNFDYINTYFLLKLDQFPATIFFISMFINKLKILGVS